MSVISDPIPISRNEKAIHKEKRYAEKRFMQLLEQVDNIPFDLELHQIEAILLELDTKWRNFCKNLIYISPNGKDEFIEIAKRKSIQNNKSRALI